MTPNIIFGSIGIVLLAMLVFEAYRYIKGHPQVLADIQKDLAFIKGVLHGSGLVKAVAPTTPAAPATPASPSPSPTPPPTPLVGTTAIPAQNEDKTPTAKPTPPAQTGPALAPNDLATGGERYDISNAEANKSYPFLFTLETRPGNKARRASMEVRMVGDGLRKFAGTVHFAITKDGAPVQAVDAPIGNYSGVPSAAIVVGDNPDGRYGGTMTLDPAIIMEGVNNYLYLTLI